MNVTKTSQESIQRFFSGAYLWMSIGLITTAATAAIFAQFPGAMDVLFSSRLVYFGLIFTQLSLAVGLSSYIFSMSYGAAICVFMTYAALTGATLSCIFWIYSLESIMRIFCLTGGMFGGMATYGMLTKRDISHWGSTLLMGLGGLCLVQLAGLFFPITGEFDRFLSCAGVVIFTLLAAYDTYKLRIMAEAIGDDEAIIDQAALLGAFVLYLDFMNLFLYLLRLLGKRRD